MSYVQENSTGSNASQAGTVKHLKQWLQDRLERADDGSIDHAMSRVDVQTATVMRATLHRVIEIQHIKAGNTSYCAHLFAIPISIKAMDELQPECFELEFMPELLSTFRNKGLLRRKDGLVMLKKLVSHEQLAATPYSQLYSLAKSMLGTHLRVGDKTEEPELADGDFPLCLPVPEGFVSARFMVGVAFWEENIDPPPLCGGPGLQDTEGWRHLMDGMLRMQFMNHPYHNVLIDIGAPKPIYSAILDGVKTVINAVLGGYLAERSEHKDELEISLHVSADTANLGGCSVTIDVISPVKQTHWSYSINMRAPDIQRLEETYKEIATIFNAVGVRVKSKSYTSFLDCGHAAGYCH